MTKKLILALLIMFFSGTVSIGQNSSGELVSKRIANAINSGKFYMKISGEFSADGYQMVTTTGLAIKDGVTMARIESYGVVTLGANGYTYTLDEKNKTYTCEQNRDGDPDWNFGKLTFQQ